MSLSFHSSTIESFSYNDGSLLSFPTSILILLSQVKHTEGANKQLSGVAHILGKISQKLLVHGLGVDQVQDKETYFTSSCAGDSLLSESVKTVDLLRWLNYLQVVPSCGEMQCSRRYLKQINCCIIDLITTTAGATTIHRINPTSPYRQMFVPFVLFCFKYLTILTQTNLCFSEKVH